MADVTLEPEAMTDSAAAHEEPKRLYLDNAATSFPKPAAVLEAMTHYATKLGASAGRGAYAEAIETGELLAKCRAAVNRLIGGTSPEHCVFALNCTDGLNIALRGLIDPFKPGHAVCTEVDHNSILRPVHAMADQWKLEFTAAKVDPKTTIVDPQAIKNAIRPDTKYVAITHASNVTGAVQPIREIGKICREMAVPLIVDAAQSLGHVAIDVEADCIDVLAAPGHKAAMGPLGTGFLYLRPGMEKHVRPLREGGTGSRSDLPTHPETMPDRYEPGSHNAIGLAGLLAGLEWIEKKGLDQIIEHEAALVQVMIDGLIGIENLAYHGPAGVADRIGVFSFRVAGYAPHELSAVLESGFGILSRSGIHCAPWVHRALGTLDDGGTTRLSFGPFVTQQDVRYAADALAQVAQG